MCLSTKPSSYQQMLHDSIKAECIYSKDYNGGTLYGLIHTKPCKRHGTLDKAVTSLDAMISKPGTTSFVSISDVLSCKVKTFQAGEHAIDEHYNVIFTNKNPGSGKKIGIHPGVKVWTAALAREKEGRVKAARVFEDDDVEQRLMREDPAAFGFDEDESMDEISEEDEPPSPPSPVRINVPIVQPISQVNSPSFSIHEAGPSSAQGLKRGYKELDFVTVGSKVDSARDAIKKQIEESDKQKKQKMDEVHDEVKATRGDVSNHGAAYHRIVNSIQNVMLDMNGAVFDQAGITHGKIDALDTKVSKVVGTSRDVSKLINKVEHAEHISRKVRGQLSGHVVRLRKPTLDEMSRLKRELAISKRQNADKDKLIAGDIAILKTGQEELKTGQEALKTGQEELKVAVKKVFDLLLTYQ